jgi:thiamine-phosphate pyrophosphorylase
MKVNVKLYRVLDANANRAREGLRVVEEYLRLVLDDAEFSARLKELRHAVTASVVGMRVEDQLLAARMSDGDVGATDPEGAESGRDDMLHVVTANLRRTQEALRVLEEYSKLVSEQACAEFKRLRFATYTLEKDMSSARRKG